MVSDDLTMAFDTISDIQIALADSNYVVVVSSPVETASSITINASKASHSGSLTIDYNPASISGWTGDVSACNEKEMAEPCGSRECGT